MGSPEIRIQSDSPLEVLCPSSHPVRGELVEVVDPPEIQVVRVQAPGGSATQTLALRFPWISCCRRAAAAGLSILIVLGYAIVPISVLVGWIE